MKIALIGPGILPIPPSGWGAVEILIWNYATILREKGHQVNILNEIRISSADQEAPYTTYCQRLIHKINTGDYDFVHLHYDCLYHIMLYLTCPKKAITSHYPYIDQLEKHRGDGYSPIFDYMIRQTDCINFVLAEKDAKVLLQFGARPENIRLMKNGVQSSSFQYQPTATFESESGEVEKTIYLGKITPRKNQAKYQSLIGVDFVGDYEDSNFNHGSRNYLGAWTRGQIHRDLTKYVNLLLISQGEADPLVIKEALVAGLGVVTNQGCFEPPKNEEIPDFITILEEDSSKLGDLEYIQQKIEENKQICRGKRDLIRAYGIRHFDMDVVMEEYVSHILDSTKEK
jgi:hypothetical protein